VCVRFGQRTRTLAVEPVVRTLSVAGLGRRVGDGQALQAGVAPRAVRVARLRARRAVGELWARDCSEPPINKCIIIII
jgi:hypothetical protein